MRSFGAGLLFLTGIAVAAYGYYPTSVDRESELATATLIVTPAGRAAEQVASGNGSAPLASTSKVATRRVATNPGAPPSAAWTPKVTVSGHNPAITSQRRLTSSKPGDDETRRDLTRNVQMELRRVGCYEGEITGAWTGSTKRAMSTFIDRVNAALPVEEPDYILLTLLQGHAERACGNGCPSGQSVSSDGHCLPNAVIAQTTRKAQRAERKLAQERAKADANSLRIADVRNAEASRGATVAAPVAAAGPITRNAETLPWQQTPQRVVRPVETVQPGRQITAANPVELLPGRMSIGGPAVEPGLGKSSVTAIEPSPVIAAVAAPTNAPSANVAVIDPSASTVQTETTGIAVDTPGALSKTATSRKHDKYGTPAFRTSPYAANRARKNSYASNGYSKGRKYQPRRGTASYNLMLGLGGIY